MPGDNAAAVVAGERRRFRCWKRRSPRCPSREEVPAHRTPLPHSRPVHSASRPSRVTPRAFTVELPFTDRLVGSAEFVYQLMLRTNRSHYARVKTRLPGKKLSVSKRGYARRRKAAYVQRNTLRTSNVQVALGAAGKCPRRRAAVRARPGGFALWSKRGPARKTADSAERRCRCPTVVAQPGAAKLQQLHHVPVMLRCSGAGPPAR